MRPFSSTLNTGMCVSLPNVPVVSLTVASVVANVPVPDPDTSPINVIVWSPVFDPDSVVIPNLFLIELMVSSPVLTPIKLEPWIIPVDTTLVGVISPSPIVKVPELVIGPPLTKTPPWPVAATLVTVPPAPVLPPINGVSLPFASNL